MYFKYGNKEIEYLSSKDKKLGEAIEEIGHINRPVTPGLFFSIVHNILGQQISTAAHITVTNRFLDLVGEVNAENILSCSKEELQSVGITFRKAEYIQDFAQKVHDGDFDVNALDNMSDEAVIKELSQLKGIGQWTAEMIMTFAMERPDIVSYGDLAILRGMRMLYRHREIDKKKFEKYRKRYSPYGTVASLYLWAIAGGAIPRLTDPGKKKVKK